VGRPLKARIVAHKAGHALHTQLVTRLLADRTLWTETTGTHECVASGSALSDPIPAAP
jgi:UDP-3-O-acyl-N-acetylglucosamine deacetylase